MTPNDVQIDVLMRRHANHAGTEAAPDHLDADELSAFAEGCLPPAARARYVSHLADCDNCRQMVSQLAISAGVVAKAEPAEATESERASWPQRLATFFAPRTLRYAAFAVVLIATAGVVFLVARRQANNSTLVARNEQGNQAAVTAVKPTDQVAPQANVGDSARPEANRNGATSAANPRATPERDESKVAANTVPPPKPTAETSTATRPSLAAKSAEPPMTESQPSYAPPPPGEGQRAESRSREQQNVGGLTSGPRKAADSSVDKYKTTVQGAETTVAKDRPVYASNRAAMNQPAQSNQRAVQEKRSGPRQNLENNAATSRNANEPRAEGSKKESSGTASAAKSEEAPETRLVGGRKFRKQGNVWVDLKFKSSMSPRSVSRGSDEFSTLDSGLRSIASQLTGEIIVVWKNKAYRIR